MAWKLSQYYQRVRLWSPITGGYVVRISMCDDRGGEFFMNIPDTRNFRWLRNKIHGQDLGGEYIPGALDILSRAIELGEEPGERSFEGEFA